jgi:hypothetical protein
VNTTNSDGQIQHLTRAEIETFDLDSTDPFEHQRVRNDRIEYLKGLNRSKNPPVKLTYSTLHPADRSAFDELYSHMKQTLFKYGHLPRPQDFLELLKVKGDTGIKALFNDSEEDKNLVINQILFTRSEEQLLEDGYYRVCQIMLTHFYDEETQIIEITYEDVFPALGMFDNLLYLELINPVHEKVYTNDLPQLRQLELAILGEKIISTRKEWLNYHLFTRPKILDKSVFLSNIRWLRVLFMPIYEFPDLAGDQTSNIVKMSFRNLTFSNGIDNLAKYALKFPMLLSVDFYGTVGIKAIKHGWSKLNNLHTLDISDHTLEYISPDLAFAPNLIRISIRSEELAVYDPFIIHMIKVVLESNRLFVSIHFVVSWKGLNSGNFESQEIKNLVTDLFKKQNELNRYYANLPDEDWIKINKRGYDLMIKTSEELSWFDDKIYTYFTSFGMFGYIDSTLKYRGNETNVPTTEKWDAFTIYYGPISINPRLDLFLYPIDDNPEDPRYI